MLAGLQSEVDSLFPALRGLTPDDSTLREGEQKLKYGRVIKISGYKTEVFDMHNQKERAAYTKRMLDLSRRAQLGTVRILVHDRQTLHRKDGSSGWFGYLEWMEYTRVNNDAGDGKEKRHGKSDKVGG
jgi:hypothetical protein